MFPGLQGSPLLHAVAAKAVCLGEALRPEFKMYARRVLENARALAETLVAGGLTVVTGGTDTPLMLVDLRPLELTGDVASESLERAGLTANKNAIPFDPKPPAVTSGLRLGVSAGTTRASERRNSRSSARPSSTSWKACELLLLATKLWKPMHWHVSTC